MEVISQAGKHVSFQWEEKSKSVVVKWDNFFAYSAEFLSAVADTLKFAKQKNAMAWIVDASASGSLIRKELLEKMQSEIIPKLKDVGVKYFISIPPKKKENVFASITEQRYRDSVKKLGITVFIAEDLDGAFEYLSKYEKNI